MIILRNISLPLDANFRDLRAVCAEKAGIAPEAVRSLRLIRKSVDARRRNDVHFLISAAVDAGKYEKNILRRCRDAEDYSEPRYVPAVPLRDRGRPRPVIIGSGPAGLFCGLTLARAGYAPLILERGSDVDKRTERVKRFWKALDLDTECNVQFGEGGAGTFSDGKLNTGTKNIRRHAVLSDFVSFGAPEDILYSAEPHVGTDLLRNVVRNVRGEIIRLGGEVRFDCRVSDIILKNGRVAGLVAAGVEIPCDTVAAAIGHSARDTFDMLYHRGVPMQQKPFAVGVRIEHLQEDINKARYGDFFNHPALGAASYKLAEHLKNGRGVYTFCMCPGGTVVAAQSERGSVVTNGMSLHARDGKNANSAVLVGVGSSDFGSEHVLAGVEFQRKIERAAYAATGSYRAPAQRFGDFREHRSTAAFGDVSPSFTAGAVPSDISACLPNDVCDSIREGILLFDRKIRGFAVDDAVLTAPETRSSSPVRILRNEKMESPVCGLYPCGEGAGYAGGIVSAAVDGMLCAEAILQSR